MNLNEKQKSTLVIVVVLGAFMIVGALYYKMMFAAGAITETHNAIKKLDGEIADAKKEAAEIEAIMKRQDEFDALQAEISKKLSRLPETVDAPGFFNSLVSVLRTTGILQEVVKPESVQSEESYKEIPYGISAFGRYHEVGQFLTLIEQNPSRFMRVKSFSIDNNIDRPSIHPVNMRIATFMFDTTIPPLPPKEVKKAKGKK